MVRLVLDLKAGTRICNDNVGTCKFCHYLGGQSGEKVYRCGLFSELLDVEENDPYRRTKRLEVCLRTEEESAQK